MVPGTLGGKSDAHRHGPPRTDDAVESLFIELLRGTGVHGWSTFRACERDVCDRCCVLVDRISRDTPQNIRWATARDAATRTRNTCAIGSGMNCCPCWMPCGRGPAHHGPAHWARCAVEEAGT